MFFVHTKPAQTPFLGRDMKSVYDCVEAFGTHLHLPQDCKLPLHAWSVLDKKPTSSSMSTWMLLHRDGKQRAVYNVHTTSSGVHFIHLGERCVFPFQVKRYERHQHPPLAVCFANTPFPGTSSSSAATSALYKEAEEEETVDEEAPKTALGKPRWEVWLARSVPPGQKRMRKYPFSLFRATAGDGQEQTIQLFYNAQFPSTAWCLTENDQVAEYVCERSSAAALALRLYDKPNARLMHVGTFCKHIANKTLKPC